MEREIFKDWQQEDELFVQTKASEKVESVIKKSNLVIVAGHSGSGKSAIIQHVELVLKLKILPKSKPFLFSMTRLGKSFWMTWPIVHGEHSNNH